MNFRVKRSSIFLMDELDLCLAISFEIGTESGQEFSLKNPSIYKTSPVLIVLVWIKVHDTNSVFFYALCGLQNTAKLLHVVNGVIIKRNQILRVRNSAEILLRGYQTTTRHVSCLYSITNV